MVFKLHKIFICDLSIVPFRIFIINYPHNYCIRLNYKFRRNYIGMDNFVPHILVVISFSISISH
jgi:hypothetical protein